MTSRLTLLTIFLFTFNFQHIHAQDLDTVTIAGRIMDQAGAMIPGAEIQAKLIKTGLTRTTTSDNEGRYRLIQLEPGTYTIRVSASGFAPQEMTSVATVSGQSLQLDATLLPSDLVVEPVVITDAGVPIVDTKRTVVGATLTARDTELLQSTLVRFWIFCSRFLASLKNHSRHATSLRIATRVTQTRLKKQAPSHSPVRPLTQTT